MSAPDRRDVCCQGWGLGVCACENMCVCLKYKKKKKRSVPILSRETLASLHPCQLPSELALGTPEAQGGRRCGQLAVRMDACHRHMPAAAGGQTPIHKTHRDRWQPWREAAAVGRGAREGRLGQVDPGSSSAGKACGLAGCGRLASASGARGRGQILAWLWVAGRGSIREG